MYSINLKNKFDITLKAISSADKAAKSAKNLSCVNEKNNIYFVINKKEFNLPDFNYAVRNFFATHIKNVNIDVNSFLALIDSKYHQAVITWFLTNHELLNFLPFNLKSDKKPKITNNFIVDKKYQKLVDNSKLMVDAFNFSRELQLMPSNYLNPNSFAQKIKKLFEPYKNILEIKILNRQDLAKKKMNLILSVGNASNEANSPKLISIKFKNTKPTFAVVGKGITFDTGGINLKPGVHMTGMQYDMSGAAIAAGIMYAFCLNKIKPNFAVVMPLAVNDIGSNCTKVGDVITSYSKKTVEITNTDAEGRLILADAMTYAIKDLGVKSIATIATLTGAIIIALGDVYTGYWSSNIKNAALFVKAANNAGEYVWNMPFNNEFSKPLKKSLLADLINCVEKGNASSISAACFLKEFADGVDFIHLDIAGSSETKARGFSRPLPVMLNTLFEFVKENFHGKK